MYLFVNFRMKWLLCACMSTVQAPAKDVSWSWCTSVRRDFFFVNFRIKWLLCMRMSTVQAPGKYVCRHFTSEFPYKGDDDDAVGDAFDWCGGGEGWRSIYYVLVI